MKRYDYDCDAGHSWAIFEIGSEADPNVPGEYDGVPDERGGIVGTSEWIWMSEDDARRICAALTYFGDVSTEEIERLVKIRLDAYNAIVSIGTRYRME
jgi:hypothetical protein